MSTTANMPNPVAQPQPPKPPRRRKRKGKGARARARRLEAQEQKAAEQAKAEGQARVLAAQKAKLPLKKGDVVVTVPSERFPKSTELVVYNFHWHNTRGDWMVSFSDDGSNFAWLKNLGRSYFLKTE
ncbi:hypothetical protein OAM67_01505 [bacterium]|nr:hypothetical protein [bacterium]